MNVLSKLIFCILVCSGHLIHSQPTVPSSLIFGDVEFKIHASGKKKIVQKIQSLTRNKAHFEEYARRCHMYFPLIEQIFKEEGVPSELKFLSLQESALLADAVSKSNAVGYWQFKKPTAQEYRLRVDYAIDERKHIVSATHAAAKYLKNNHYFLKNWYATLLSYNMGLSGVRSYLGKKPSNKVVVTEKTHFYVLHFLAHWLAFQDAVSTSKSANLETLIAYKKTEGKRLPDIAKFTRIPLEKVKFYNQWLKIKYVPFDKKYSVLLPVPDSRLTEVYSLLGKSNIASHEIQTSVFESKKDIYEIGNPNHYPIITDRNKKVIDGQEVVFVIANMLSAVEMKRHFNILFLSNVTKMSQKKLRRINEIGLLDDISKAKIIYTKRKKRKAQVKFHILQANETLWEVSQRYGIRKKRILKYNRLKNERQTVAGQVLWLQSKRPKNVPVEVRLIEVSQVQSKPKVKNTEPKKSTPTLLKNEQQGFHVVKQGETLLQIAQKYGVTVIHLVEWNQLDAKTLNIQEGQVLKWRNDSSSPKEKIEILDDIAYDILKTKKEAIEEKVITESDTVPPISRQEEIEILEEVGIDKVDIEDHISALEEATKTTELTSAQIAATQSIREQIINNRLPFDAVSENYDTLLDAQAQSSKNQTQTHTVQAEETLYRIAKQYTMSVDELKKINQLTSNNIRLGQVLKVATSSVSPPAASIKFVKQTKIHRVKKGETFYSIARKYNTNVKNLAKLNQMQNLSVFVGQELKVPNASNNSQKSFFYHVVKQGETLYRIASMYEVTIGDLKAWNNKANLIIKRGDQLKVLRK